MLYMKAVLLFLSVLIATISIIYSTHLLELLTALTDSLSDQSVTITSQSNETSMSVASTAKKAMSKLTNAKFVPRRSSDRGHASHGWLNTYHTFSFADYYEPKFQNFGSLRVLNEDRVAAGSGFPTHPHRDAEIFSYILSGELTHRDSMIKKGAEGAQGDQFYRMKRGDVQFTTGGTGKDPFISTTIRKIVINKSKGIAHSEGNEGTEEVHFLQIWALPWARGLKPIYHTRTFSEEAKRQSFLPILSPLAAGPGASAADEEAAVPTVPETIPIHADMVMAAGLIKPDSRFKYTVGGQVKDGKPAVRNITDRKVYVHIPMTKNGSAKVRLDGREDAVLGEGDGAFITGVSAGDVLSVESVGEAEAEVVVLDSN
jgi:quercetin 2,3-dioxygenase